MKRLLTLLLLLCPGPAWAGDWEEIGKEDGITAWQRAVQGTSLVEFRGRGVVEAPILKLAAVIRLNAREKEWMESCTESYTIKYVSALDAVSYNRTGSPFFLISDRDTVVKATATIDGKKRELRVDFQNVDDKSAPERPDAIRMPSVIGSWVLTELDPQHTDVTYQIHADPGGALPKWVVNWASKELPLLTIKNLRAQALKPGYENDQMILERAIDWSGFLWCAGAHTETAGSPQ